MKTIILIKGIQFDMNVDSKVKMKGEPRGRRGRKPAKLDSRMKLEKSQQSARECRARKKLRYKHIIIQHNYVTCLFFSFSSLI